MPKIRSGLRTVITAALVTFLVAGVLLTPLARLETRPVSDVTGVGVVVLGLFFVGLILALVALVLVLLGRASSLSLAILPILAAVLYVPGLVADQTGHLSKLPHPTAIFWVELIQAVIALVLIVLALSAVLGQPARRPSA
jgi:hypothetical protein